MQLLQKITYFKVFGCDLKELQIISDTVIYVKMYVLTCILLMLGECVYASKAMY